jgi:hypothetical protein
MIDYLQENVGLELKIIKKRLEQMARLICFVPTPSPIKFLS